MNAGTPKDTKFNLTINNKTPSQKSTEEKDKNDKNNFQTNNNKKTPLPNFVDRNEINEKNFPQKANFFNEKMNSIKSPIIDYFSPSFYLQKYNSPEEIIHQSKIVLRQIPKIILKSRMKNQTKMKKVVHCKKELVFC